MTLTGNDAWCRALDDVLEEGQGLLQLALLHPHAIVQLASAALGDGDQQRRLLCIVRDVVVDMLETHTAPTPAAPFCLLCDSQFWRDQPPQVIAILSADVPDPRAHFVAGICATCRDTHRGRALQTATLTGLRTRFGLSIRQLPPMAAAGNA